MRKKKNGGANRSNSLTVEYLGRPSGKHRVGGRQREAHQGCVNRCLL